MLNVKTNLEKKADPPDTFRKVKLKILPEAKDHFENRSRMPPGIENLVLMTSEPMICRLCP